MGNNIHCFEKIFLLSVSEFEFFIFTEDMVHQEEAEKWIALSVGAIIEVMLKSCLSHDICFLLKYIMSVKIKKFKSSAAQKSIGLNRCAVARRSVPG